MQFFKPAEYQPTILRAYTELRAQLVELLPTAEVEHIGSSAIKGAISKGDLDVLVRATRAEYSGSLEKLVAIGFKIKPDTLRTESLTMLEGSSGVAVQLIEKGSKFEMFVTFRDRMNANQRLVDEYNQLKLACTGLPAEEYRARKSAFIQKILGE